MKSICSFASERYGIRCQLPSGHPGDHRAWNNFGVPTLKVAS